MARWISLLMGIALAMQQSLVAAPMDESDQVQQLRQAVRSLAADHREWTLTDPLKALLKDVPADVQIQALLPLMTDERPPQWTRAHIQPAICDQLAEIGDLAIDALLDQLDSASAVVREAAAYTICRTAFKHQQRFAQPWGDKAAAKLAKIIRDDPDPNVRLVVADAIDSLGRSTRLAADPLLARFTDPDSTDDPATPYYAMIALAKVESDAWRAVPKLRQIIRDHLNDSDDRRWPDWNYWAPDTLREMGPAAADAIPELLGILAAKRTEPHLSASNALFWIGSDALQPWHVPVAIDAAANTEKTAPAWVLAHLHPDSAPAAMALISALQHQPSITDGQWHVEALVRIRPDDPVINTALQNVVAKSTGSNYILAQTALALRTGNYEPLFKTLDAALACFAHPQGTDSRHDYAEAVACALALRLVGPRASAFADRIPIDTSSRSPWAVIAWCRAYHAATGNCYKTLPYLARQMLPTDTNAAHEDVAAAFSELGPLAEPALDSILTSLSTYAGYSSSERFHACQSLSVLGPSPASGRALPGLQRIFRDDPSPFNQRVAAEAIWFLTHDSSLTVPPLLQTLRYRGRNVFWVMKFIEHLGPRARSAAPALRIWCLDDNPYYRAAAERALACVLAPLPPADCTGQNFDRWYTELADDDPRIAVEALWYFVEAGPPARAYLRMRADDSPLFSYFRSVDQHIVDLDDAEYKIRQAAHDALTRLAGDLSVRDKLNAVLEQKPSPEVAWRICSILQNTPPQSASSWPCDNLPDNRRVGRILQILQLLDPPPIQTPTHHH